MGNIKMLEELAKAYIDGMPLENIKDKIKDIVITYHGNCDTVTIHIYLNNNQTSHISIYIDFGNMSFFTIGYKGKTIKEITSYFKILGFREIS